MEEKKQDQRPEELDEALTDEQMDEAAGGGGDSGYTCTGCGRYFWGAVPCWDGNQPYCTGCYNDIRAGYSYERR